MAPEVRTLTLPGGIPLEVIYCPAGRFQMGSSEKEGGRDTDERRHEVEIQEGFWLGRFSVTQSQWECIMGKCTSWFRGEMLPVANVSFYDCQSFAYEVGKIVGVKAVLPTEAEWEYACRAGTETAYGWGDDPGFGNRAHGPIPVTQCRQNLWGFAGMHGNVYEWCADWYDADYGCGKGARRTFDTDRYRVLKGGCWSSDVRDCRSAFRDREEPGFRCPEIGFRICCKGLCG